jgi:hypothetical protein
MDAGRQLFWATRGQTEVDQHRTYNSRSVPNYNEAIPKTLARPGTPQF